MPSLNSTPLMTSASWLEPSSFRHFALADKISDTVAGFARTGNPNVGKLPEWRPYDSEERATMVWNDHSQLVNDPIAAQRQILQPIVNL